MALYVDRLIDYTGRVPYRHKVWCHLVADTDDELLAAAAELGGAHEWMQGTRGWDTHFDLPAPWREAALDLGAVEVDFRFMALRTRSRRAALALGAAQAVGAPVGSTIEFALPTAGTDGWRVDGAPEGVAITWRTDHPLLTDRTVAVLSAEDDRSTVVTFVPDRSPASEADPEEVEVAAVWSSSTRPSGPRPPA